ncbi:MAG TPA: hydantoinase B/oxoprolinase family protein [Gammaproteobacteria bacterium]
MSQSDGTSFWIDRGGTFTDVIARAPSGAITALKLLSHDPDRYEDAAVEGVRRLLAAAPAGERRIAGVRMGTTVATNALLERRGEPTLLVITRGFADAIRIGTQQRPEIFALDIRLPEMLYVATVEAHERISAQGEVLEPLDEARLAADLEAARRSGLASVAIVLLHGYRYPEHERRAAAIAREAGFEQVSVSHEVMPVMKLVPRGDTTLADAYLSPVLRRYVRGVRAGLERHLGDAPLLFMQSHGGLVEGDAFRGKDSILSGPAGGVVGMAAAARAAGFERVIGFDMGGTSTDVSLYDGRFERTTSAVMGGVRLAAPMMRIHTVAAGGGSLLKFEGGRLQVGPESAGADPGPACYRNGGPLAITDANLCLGRIQPDFFPHVFGPGADQPLDTAATAARFAELGERVARETGERLDAAELAAGFLRIAVERMANAIKRITVERGIDAREFVLCAFGGAAGQHACQVADALGIGTVLLHRLAGLLSAYGMGAADLSSVHRQSVEAPLDDASLAALARACAELERPAREALERQAVSVEEIAVERRLFLKSRGSDTALPVAWSGDANAAALAAAFHAAHERHFGFRADGTPVAIEALELEAVGRTGLPAQEPWLGGTREPRPAALRSVWFEGGWRETPIYRRDDLAAGASVEGPAVIAEENATTVVEPGWRASVDALGNLLLTRAVPRAERERVGERADPVMLEVFNALFMNVAEQMGAVLEQTAHSVNIKERLDFSCALFDADGALIANAPHIPVHLGSMGDTVRAILDRHGDTMAPGDSFASNAPYSGGTHLPDVTVVTPVFDPATRRLLFIVASRAHHADIGGLTPGSMPPRSRVIEEEGVVLEAVPVVRGGRLLEAEVRALLAGGPYPARNPDQNVADLKAQLAANARGIAELEKLIARFGVDVVRAYMGHVQRNAEECVREAIERLDDGEAEMELDGGERIVVRVRVDRARREAVIDFTGTSPATASNFNAPASIARAAVLYVFRTLVARNIPLNAGCLKPLEIALPEGSLLNPRYPAAVAAGNVETSQCITDALLAALGVCAASQGTMNNLTFGTARHQYYETICGGAGAGPDFDGASAVHTHMTNSRLTDPEVIEWRHPVRIRRFAIRRGSGGAGRRRGGDGVVREIEFLEPMHVAILSNRRRIAPPGLAGGGDGAPGRNTLIRASGATEPLPATAETDVAPGDRIVIETPGGGGYGAPDR